MKSLMKLFSTVLIFVLVSCGSSNRTGCLAEYSDLYKLEEDFRKELKLLFDLNTEPKGEHYKKYIEQVLNYSIPKSFFVEENKVKEMESLRRSDSFKLLWSKLSVIEEQSNESLGVIEEDIKVFTGNGEVDTKEKKDMYVINPNSEIFTCLIENLKNPDAQEMFEVIQMTGGLSPMLIGGALIQLDDFDNPMIQSYIVLQFYSDYILMINKLSEV